MQRWPVWNLGDERNIMESVNNGEPARRRNNGHGTSGNPKKIRVLMYHRIVSDRETSRRAWTCLHVDEFRRQLELLDNWGFTTITFRDYQLFREGKLHLPRKPIILTFDDGYLDTVQYALPLLQEFGMKAVIFVLGDRRIRTNYWDEALGHDTAHLLDAEQIVALHKVGFEIGAHTMTHARLTELPPREASEEIVRAKMLLEILLNSTVNSFSYPYGLVNEVIKGLVRASGFSHACSVYSGPPVFDVEPFEIRRSTILNSTTIAGFAARILAPFQYYEWLRWKAGRSLPAVSAAFQHGRRNGIHPPSTISSHVGRGYQRP